MAVWPSRCEEWHDGVRLEVWREEGGRRVVRVARVENDGTRRVLMMVLAHGGQPCVRIRRRLVPVQTIGRISVAEMRKARLQGGPEHG